MGLLTKDDVRNILPQWLKGILANIITSGIVGAAIRNGREYLELADCRVFIKHARISHSEVARLYFGLRESAEVSIVKKHLPINDSTTVVELGCSIGYVASIVTQFRPKRMLLVEPDTELIDIAKRNLQINVIPGTAVDFGNVAVSYDGKAYAEFFCGETTTSGKTVGNVRSSAESTFVEALTLSKILAKFQVDDYVLISDIEGAEADIWFKDEHALAGCNSIVVELEETEKHSISEQVKKIESLGFSEKYRYGRVFLFTRRFPQENTRA